MPSNEAMLRTRINIAKKCYWNKNCVGTALFVAGESKKDVYATPYFYDMAASGLPLLSEPCFGAIAVWDERLEKKVTVLHMGIVTQVNPTLVTHRHNWGKEVIENQPIEELCKEYSGEPRFYLPSIFIH
jgi:hypothetical protein